MSDRSPLLLLPQNLESAGTTSPIRYSSFYLHHDPANDHTMGGASGLVVRLHQVLVVR
jgi:hypothetical protein